MKSILVDRRYFSFFCGVLIFVIGIVIFTNFFPEDFLQPGFVEDGIVIQNEQILPQELTSGIMTITNPEKDMVINIYDPLLQIPVQLEIKDSNGETLYNSKVITKTSIMFKPYMIGKYNVLITNLGSKTSELTVNYGHKIHNGNQDNLKSTLDMSAVCMIITGAYLIIHTDFKILSKTKNRIF